MTEPIAPPSLKRLRIDDANDTPSTDVAKSSYPLPNAPSWRQDPKYAHRAHLYGRATQNNVADSPHFAKNTALVYQFLIMDEVVENDTDGLLSCTFHCGICGQGTWHWVKAGKSRGSTTNMKRHVEDRHNAIWVAAEQSDELASLRAKDKSLPASAELSLLEPSEVSETFMDVFYKKLVQWIVMRNHPFTEIENDEFQELLLHLKPALSDHFIQADALRNRIFGHAGAQRQRLKAYLMSTPGLLAIACDAWTSSNRIAFLAITASWITTQWEREETLIDFRELHGAHTGQNMAQEVASVVSELGIKDKVLALVSDNASNNGTLVAHLTGALGQPSSQIRWDSSKGHIWCLPHVIHLAVMALLLGINAIPHGTDVRSHIDDDSLFTEEDAENVVASDDREAHEDDIVNKIDPIVNLKSACDKIRKISRIIEEDNEQHAKSRNLSYMKKRVKNLVLDVVTRWNSLYFMLERALEFREAIDVLCSQSKVTIYHPYSLSNSDWAAVLQICGWLKFFRGATQKMSGQKYPTLSLSLRVYALLINYVSKLEGVSPIQSVPSISAGLKACKDKLLEFFDRSTFDSEYYYFATVLDPRFKGSLFKNEPDLFSTEWVDDCATALRETCQQHYASKSYPVKLEDSDDMTESLDPNDFESAWQVGIPMESTHTETTMSVEDKIAMYLAEPLTHMSPLDWWRTNSHRFPRLAAMARDFLSIPGSSVAVERVLSAGRDVISLRRASLTAETIRVLMTYRAGLLLEKRLQRV